MKYYWVLVRVHINYCVYYNTILLKKYHNSREGEASFFDGHYSASPSIISSTTPLTFSVCVRHRLVLSSYTYFLFLFFFLYPFDFNMQHFFLPLNPLKRFRSLGFRRRSAVTFVGVNNFSIIKNFYTMRTGVWGGCERKFLKGKRLMI